MGNEPSKSGRGQALGSGQRVGSSQQAQSSYYQQQQAAQARSKLVTAKPKKTNELQRKEKILQVLEQADNAKNYERAQQNQPVMSSTIPSHNQPKPPYATNPVSTTVSSSAAVPSKSQPTSTTAASRRPPKADPIFMAEPSTAEARAAEARLNKFSKKSNTVSVEQRKNRTRDLLFGDGLKGGEPSPSPNNSSSNLRNTKATTSTEGRTYKTESDVFVASGKASEAALNRLQTKSRTAASKERKARTIQLLHGDLLKNDNEPKAEPRQPTAERQRLNPDKTPQQLVVDQSFMNLQNCNAHESVPPTARLLYKIIDNILGADDIQKQEKFGKLRLSNKKIRASFVDLVGGIECLQALGFEKQTIVNDDGAPDDFMVYNFQTGDKQLLWYAKDLIDLHYPPNQ